MLQSLGGLSHLAANSLDSLVAFPHLKVVRQRRIDACVETLCELFVRRVIEIRLQRIAIVEFENGRERILRRRELFVRATEHDARSDARTANRRNVTSRARERRGKGISLIVAKTRFQTKQNDVKDHRDRGLGGRAFRLSRGADFDGGR
jgi:hypothetical protein